jgi:hypothetical protein
MAKDLSHLSGGNTHPPDRPSELGKMLMAGWLEKIDGEETRPKAADTKLRASNAGMCTRRLWFDIDDPRFDATPADRWRMALGTMVHEKIEEDMVPMLLSMKDREWVDVQTEPKFDLTLKGVSLSGHGDLFIVDKSGHRGVVEIKTVGGFKFKQRAFAWDGGPKGPEAYHLRQVGLAAEGLDADWLALLYVAFENLSPSKLAEGGRKLGLELEDWDRFIAEWVFTREEMQPLIDDEMRRLRLVSQAHDMGKEAGDIPRVVVVDGPQLGGQNVTITEPKKSKAPWEIRDVEGELLQVGDTWHCGYCPHFDACVEAG